MLAGRFVGSIVGSTMRGSAQVRRTVNGRSEKPAACTRLSSVSAQSVMAWLRAICAAPVALDEILGVRRTVAFVEQVELGIACDGVVLVDDGRIHPRGEHVGTTGMRGAGHVAVGGRQVGQSGRGPHALQRRHVRVDGLCLVGRHQRTATGIAQQHNGFHALNLAQPAHPDADVDQCVVEQEAALEAAVSGCSSPRKPMPRVAM